MAYRKKTVVAAVNELNDLLGLDPQINPDRPVKVLLEDLKEASQLLEEDDELSAETEALIAELRGEGEEEEEPEPAPEPEPVDAPEEPTDEEPPVPAPSKRGARVREVPPPEPITEPITVVRPLTRIEAIAHTIRTAAPLTRQELVAQADQLYVEHGGAPNIQESKTLTQRVINTLEAWGAIERDQNDVIRVLK
jgi:hypothetical protein